jgi:nicotinamide phosphoribosyltransferase
MNPKIGAIYGDSITLNRQKSILNLLERKGFSSSNVVLGVGSYSYQMVTRDTHGHAMKATAACVDGKYIDIFKDPKTDDGIKKSAKGLMKVTWDGEGYVLEDQVSQEEEGQGYLRTVFEDGMLIERTDAYRISSLVKEGIMNELEKEDLL